MTMTPEHPEFTHYELTPDRRDLALGLLQDALGRDEALRQAVQAAGYTPDAFLEQARTHLIIDGLTGVGMDRAFLVYEGGTYVGADPLAQLCRADEATYFEGELPEPGNYSLTIAGRYHLLVNDALGAAGSA